MRAGVRYRPIVTGIHQRSPMYTYNLNGGQFVQIHSLTHRSSVRQLIHTDYDALGLFF
jgi:hypothetical protein